MTRTSTEQPPRHPDAVYWDKGARNVPDMTGSKHLLDARDLKAVCEVLDIPLPFRSVLDVGCGTGRLSQIATRYHGADIAPSAVEYCHERAIAATLIVSPDDLPKGPFQFVTAISLFTHISREARQAYLSAFAARADDLLVDIIPGDGAGDVSVWTARPEDMLADLQAAGYEAVGVIEHQWDDFTHRYYRARRRP